MFTSVSHQGGVKLLLHFGGLSLCIIFFALSACSGMRIPEAEHPEAQLFQARCSACHTLPHPARLTKKQWVQYIRLMEHHMKTRNMTPLSDEERAKILAYLSRHARD